MADSQSLSGSGLTSKEDSDKENESTSEENESTDSEEEKEEEPLLKY